MHLSNSTISTATSIAPVGFDFQVDFWIQNSQKDTIVGQAGTSTWPTIHCRDARKRERRESVLQVGPADWYYSVLMDGVIWWCLVFS